MGSTGAAAVVLAVCYRCGPRAPRSEPESLCHTISQGLLSLHFDVTRNCSPSLLPSLYRCEYGNEVWLAWFKDLAAVWPGNALASWL